MNRRTTFFGLLGLIIGIPLVKEAETPPEPNCSWPVLEITPNGVAVTDKAVGITFPTASGGNWGTVTNVEITGAGVDDATYFRNKLYAALSEGVRFEPHQITHFRLGDDRKTFYPYGESCK